MKEGDDHRHAERRFREVFSHLGLVTAYARRRGSSDPDAIAAEAMTIAWRRLPDVPSDDPRPWLYATVRNLVRAEARRAAPLVDLGDDACDPASPRPELCEFDPELSRAISGLAEADRELLLLIAWEDLTPSQAARALGINPVACRVRLFRARKRLSTALGALPVEPIRVRSTHSDAEGA